jgi:uncharacterized membrane protein YcaP (DUF421 family)
MEAVDWAKAFLPAAPMLEIVVRGSVVYLAIFFLLRFVVRREVGSLGITDLLVIVLVADAAQNAMADDYHSVFDGIVLVATIVFWSYALDWLAYRCVWCRRVLRPPAVQIIRDGRLLQRSLDQEKISEDELMGELRAHGCDDIAKVRAAYIESDGMISVVTRSGGVNGPRRKSGLGA